MEPAGWLSKRDTQEKKRDFIQAVHEKQDIDLEPNMVKNSPGRKAIVKLMLNSFWSKFGQRDYMTQTNLSMSQKSFTTCTDPKPSKFTTFMPSMLNV